MYILLYFIVNDKYYYSYADYIYLDNDLDKYDLYSMNKCAFAEALRNFRDYMSYCDNDEEEQVYEEDMMRRYGSEEGSVLFHLFYRRYKEEH